MRFAFDCGGDDYREWFSIDPTGIKLLGSCSEEESDEFDKKRKFPSDELVQKRKFQFKQPLFVTPSYIPEWATFVAAESKIYALGGRKQNENYEIKHASEVYVYDTAADKDNADWKPLPSMLTGRSGPGVVALDGKLYVMGSDQLNEFWYIGPWCEVYDICNNCWSVLDCDCWSVLEEKPLIKYLPTECVVVVPKDRSTTPEIIVVYIYRIRRTYFYCPKLGRWNEVVLPIEFGCVSCVAVEQVLFMAAPDYLCAYDLVNDPDSADNIESTFANYKCPGFPRPKAKTIKGLEEDYPNPLVVFGVQLFHLGNMVFCLVWPIIDHYDGFKTTIHCLRFRVDKDEWRAYVLNHDCYHIPVPVQPLVFAGLQQCVQIMYVDS
ncbi:hypothetical protein FRX31_026545 [Thalictrum thalictroides]|uniref:F-box/kelch-repeat protein n=1 Tax=Thalictrum thalictroides TaxID=46969 RepID=A0A7J6VGX5_THATH|nr:hypothetical protein FRX31_026545 [Thalictrum thalictroides]